MWGSGTIGPSPFLNMVKVKPFTWFCHFEPQEVRVRSEYLVYLNVGLWDLRPLAISKYGWSQTFYMTLNLKRSEWGQNISVYSNVGLWDLRPLAISKYGWSQTFTWLWTLGGQSEVRIWTSWGTPMPLPNWELSWFKFILFKCGAPGPSAPHQF